VLDVEGWREEFDEFLKIVVELKEIQFKWF
jgi:hypothetical protein